MFRITWLIVLLAFTLSGCAANRAHRSAATASTGVPCVGMPPACPLDTWQRLPDHPSQAHNPVHLGFVEFDDQGERHRPDDADAVVARVRALAGDGPVLVVVFAHGWKHNAGANDGNVAAFAELLRRVAIEDKTACGNSAGCGSRRTVGVFLGWRGLAARAEPFRTLSFWSRKNRSLRVGNDGATEVLAELGRITGTGPNHRLVLTGHSFGAGLVYTATQQLLMRDLASTAAGDTIPHGTADLVVLVNAAIEAGRFQTIQHRAARRGYDCRQVPILAWFTSRTDVANRSLFPIGRRLSTLTQAHVDGAQSKRNRTAIGFHQPYHSHTLRRAEGSERADAAATTRFRAYADRWREFQRGDRDDWQTGDLVLSRIHHAPDDPMRFNPYFNVIVDGSIIDNHSGIWGEEFSSFLYRFVAARFSTRPDDCRLG